MVESRAVKKPVFDGQRNLDALERGLDRAAGIDGYKKPLVGDLSMFYFGLIKGRTLLDELTKFDGSPDDAWKLFHHLEMHFEDLRDDAEKLVRKMKRLRNATYAKAVREEKKHKKRK